MQEDFLHYVWQHQYFDKAGLHTTGGEQITVLKPGMRNADAGPDFLNARLQLGEVEWNGAVEIHIRASDWHRHHHQHDPKYDQVVLHVVYEADQPVRRLDGSEVPALALAPRLAPELLRTYERLMAVPVLAEVLPCVPLLGGVPDITRISMAERALLERVEQKAAVVAELHQQLGQDWEATAYHALAAAFGFQKNSEPLARLAKALPLAIVRRHRHDARQLEALLFGQAGFLAETEETRTDAYLTGLRQEFEFLRHKYSLHGTALAAHEWNFLRMRPANFPPVRLAQLAAVLHARPALFDALLSAADVPTLLRFFQAPVAEYWRGHYRPGVPGKVPALGKSSMQVLITNVVVPLRVAYARHVGQPELVESAVALLSQLPAEHNSLTDAYAAQGFEHRTAADSQGLLALHRGYCAPRRCMQCAIGSRILQRNMAIR
ncbi:DUF2851 family protein [Hymenobacter psychrotolerans]|uniref:DUF2851 domain-containing protein n=1 Tax=Hymenobacter psychrotolerans DSM 18569 TaxID=1121959 RepID=A0A1M6VHE6_9BACT|nr:DUF2851 family protein [Hymenobacter psychrotolerans]SHK80898.1 Protein of unknown function [Hymenobacter psychrotolerans DSM 18569]